VYAGRVGFVGNCPTGRTELLADPQGHRELTHNNTNNGVGSLSQGTDAVTCATEHNSNSRNRSTGEDESWSRAFQTCHRNLHLGQLCLYSVNPFIHLVELFIHPVEP